MQLATIENCIYCCKLQIAIIVANDDGGEVDVDDEDNHNDGNDDEQALPCPLSWPYILKVSSQSSQKPPLILHCPTELVSVLYWLRSKLLLCLCQVLGF